MSDANGDPNDRLEASHVTLMMDHDLFVKEHEKWLSEQERQQERWRQYDLQRQEDRARSIELDKRIAKLVSAIGDFTASDNSCYVKIRVAFWPALLKAVADPW